MDADWPGVIDTDVLQASHIEAVNRLSDASKAGAWDEVFGLLDSNHVLSANQWRITGDSWFTPLHQATWIGAPVQVVKELTDRGAWRSLRNAENQRPVDIARKRGHSHLVEILDVRESGAQELRKFAAWDAHLARLITERTERIDPVKIRQVSTEVLALEPLANLFFGYPGMYGGFSLSLHKDRLLVESWSRVVGGSGQAHVITENACVLVEEGFV